MLDNTQYIAIVATGIIVTFGLYYIDKSDNENEEQEINYTKYIIIFIVVCSVAAAGVYMYNNPSVVSETVAPSLIDESITSEIKKVGSSKDPSVIASLPDF